MKESVDYQELYGNVVKDGFMDSLNLGANSKEVIRLLFEQRDGVNPMYVPELQIEGLVSDNVSPYQAVRVLHELKERRIVIYGIAERIPRESHGMGMEDLLFTPLVAKAKEQGLIHEPEQPDESEVIVTNYDFRRVAIFNLEYPVVYYCLTEELELTEVPEDTLDVLYSAIKNEELAEMLLELGFPVILEFLNYVQSLFQQPLTEVITDEQDDTASESTGEAGGGRLVARVDSGRTGSEVSETPVYDQSVDETTGVAGDNQGQGTGEETGKGYFVDEVSVGRDASDGV